MIQIPALLVKKPLSPLSTGTVFKVALQGMDSPMGCGDAPLRVCQEAALSCSDQSVKLGSHRVSMLLFYTLKAKTCSIFR